MSDPPAPHTSGKGGNFTQMAQTNNGHPPSHSLAGVFLCKELKLIPAWESTCQKWRHTLGKLC